MNSDNNFRCEIKRSERPCLVCSGHMDLIVARPSKLNFFGGINLVCSSEGVDCLDCPKCGFKTTTLDYEYLKMCKRSRQVRSMFVDNGTNSVSNGGSTERSRKRSSRHRRASSSSHSSSFGNERSCPSCHTPVKSSSWQFCPKCGNKCSRPTQTRVSSSTGIPNDIVEIAIPITVSKELITSDDDNSITKNNSSKSADSGITQMLTPPKRTSSISDCNMSSPVEMQY